MLPFDIMSAPEHFHKRISWILSGATGTVCVINDVLDFGKKQKEHNIILAVALEKIQSAGMTLNNEKCQFSKDRITFLDQIIGGSEVHPYLNKVSAIMNIGTPENVSDSWGFLEMFNHLSKFLPILADEMKPLRDFR